MQARSSRLHRPVTAGVGLVAALALAAGAAAQEPSPAQPDERFEGLWSVNERLSQPWGAKLEQSAGPDQLRGGGRERLLPSGGGEGDLRRLRLRERLERASEAVRDIEIEVEPGEFKVISLDDDVRIFYLTRKHVRQRDDGVKVDVESVWDGKILTLIEKTDDGTTFSESYSYDAANDQLALVLLVNDEQFREPFLVRTVFDRVPTE